MLHFGFFCKKGNKSDRYCPCLSHLFVLPFQEDQNEDLTEVTVTQSEETGAKKEEVEEEGPEEGPDVEEVVVAQREEQQTRSSTNECSTVMVSRQQPVIKPTFSLCY